MQMVSWIEATSPRTVVLVHGDESAKESLSRSLRCADVICARDGIRFSAVIRRAAAATDDRPVPCLRPIVGRSPCPPPAGTAGRAALRSAAVAEAWFGMAVDRATAERFARVLESVGLVRRDDHQRDRLWVLGVQESALFPDEAELEESLKQANPKGGCWNCACGCASNRPRPTCSSRGLFTSPS